MKKGLFTAFFALCIAAIVSAQTPSAVSNAFSQANPGLTASFVLEGVHWKANVTQAGNQVSFVYTPEGTFVGKDTEIAKNAIPAPALQDINGRFSSYTFDKAAKRELADGSLQYKYQYSDGNRHVEVFYTPNGQLVSRNLF